MVAEGDRVGVAIGGQVLNLEHTHHAFPLRLIFGWGSCIDGS
jgi:hypothetical protein